MQHSFQPGCRCRAGLSDRALTAPSLADAIPRLTERARAESWTHEEFLAACLQREVASRESHGGEGRIRAARFPARKALEEFDFDYQRSLKHDEIAHLGTLDFIASKNDVVFLGSPGTGKDTPVDRTRHPSRRPPRLPVLPVDNTHVAADLAKVKHGHSLSPILAVRGDLQTGCALQTADGYHRVCASYYTDENTDIPVILGSRADREAIGA
jgi:hypothetical protein